LSFRTVRAFCCSGLLLRDDADGAHESSFDSLLARLLALVFIDPAIFAILFADAVISSSPNSAAASLRAFAESAIISDALVSGLSSWIASMATSEAVFSAVSAPVSSMPP
jgi:hypothetical protein